SQSRLRRRKEGKRKLRSPKKPRSLLLNQPAQPAVYWKPNAARSSDATSSTRIGAAVPSGLNGSANAFPALKRRGIAGRPFGTYSLVGVGVVWAGLAFRVGPAGREGATGLAWVVERWSQGEGWWVGGNERAGLVWGVGGGGGNGVNCRKARWSPR